MGALDRVVLYGYSLGELAREAQEIRAEFCRKKPSRVEREEGKEGGVGGRVRRWLDVRKS